MKTVLIVILSIMLAVSGGLLIYGTTFGVASDSGFSFGDYTEPVNPEEYASAIAEWIVLNAKDNPTLMAATNPSKDPAKFAVEVNGWYDVFGKADPSTSILVRHSGADLVPYLLIPVTYNHNRSKQYCLSYHYEVEASGAKIITDGIRLRIQPSPAKTECYYRSYVWSGTAGVTSPVTVKLEFGWQKFRQNQLKSYVESYDPETHEYARNLKYGSVEKRKDTDIEREVPYKVYSLVLLPIYVGSGADQKEDATAEITSSVIDGSTVTMTMPNDEKPYYTLSFSEDIQAAQCPENTEDCLNKALGERMKYITIKRADFHVEIWPCGLFRHATASFTVNAEINGKQGDAEIKMDFGYYYDDDSCDIVKYILEDGCWESKMSDENKALLNSRKKSA